MAALLLLMSLLLACSNLYAAPSIDLALDRKGGIEPMMKFVVNVGEKSFFQDRGTGKSWTSAEAYCKTFGMTLASINTEEQFVALRNAYSTDFAEGYWTSGRDSLKISQFVWNKTDSQVSTSYLPFSNFKNITYQTCLAFLSEPNHASTMYPRECTTSLAGVLCET